jgi:hypothetical protein
MFSKASNSSSEPFFVVKNGLNVRAGFDLALNRTAPVTATRGAVPPSAGSASVRVIKVRPSPSENSRRMK